MTETVKETTTMRRFDVARLLTILIRPREAFAPMSADKRGTWLTPMLALTLSSILAIVASGYLKTQAALGGVTELPPDWQYWTPDMQQSFMDAQQTAQGPLVNYALPMIGALVVLWLGWIVFSGVMRLVSTLLGGRGSMQSALNVVGWAGTPFIIRDILRALFMLITNRQVSSPGLSGFAETGFFSQLLARTDLFFFWNIALLAIGFSIVDGLPKRKTLVGTLVVVILWLMIQAGAGAAIANLG
ncbi:MAG: YIP1 family protein [Anaerolineales bacterium]|nr:YIP1 family protein [Anaerolineales bacterium]